MKEILSDLATPIPIYVTRQTAAGLTGDYTMPAWAGLLTILLVWFNIVAWSLIGLYEAVQVVFG